jgi:proteasome lid subunit RPN8/RPN11
MIAQAQAELPNECCGLLAGRIDKDGGIARVVERYPLVNELASSVRYLSDAKSMLKAYKDMRARGIEELAVYHSHPTSRPVPSKTDLEENLHGSEIAHFIISLVSAKAEVKAWFLGAEDYREAEWDLVD